MLCDPEEFGSPIKIGLHVRIGLALGLGQHLLPAGKIFVVVPTQGLGEQSPGFFDLARFDQLADFSL
jgi:hypothetical protein